MNHYIEIQTQPDAEFPATILMNALFNKLHKALWNLKADDIGVSFPEYDKTLGKKLRLHGTEHRLSQLNQIDWVGKMKDYCQKSDILPVPTSVKYRTVSRQQDTRSAAKLKRLLKRQESGKRCNRPELNEENIMDYSAKRLSNTQDKPFLTLRSSNGQSYRRSLVLGELQDQPVAGTFNQFGLSKTATIPWF